MVGRLRHWCLFLCVTLGAACSSTPSIPSNDVAAGDDDGGSGAGPGVSGSGGSGGGAGGPIQPDWGQAALPVGSFDVRFVYVSSAMSSGPKLDGSPSDDALLRIDFPTDCKGGADSEAEVNATPCVLRSDFKDKVLVTVQGGVTAAYDVQRTEKTLVLSTNGNRVVLEDAVVAQSPGAGGTGGSGGAVGAEGATYFASDRWSKFTFALNAQGQVVPPVQAEGLQTITVAAGQPLAVALNGTASFHADSTAPKAELVVGSSFSPPGTQFPWDPLTIRFDEPIVLDPASTVSAEPVEPAPPPPLVWQWDAGEAASTPSLIDAFGATWYRGFWRGWDTVPSQSEVRLGAFADARGNPGEGFVQRLDIKKPPPLFPLSTVDFEIAADDNKIVLWPEAPTATSEATIKAEGCEGQRCLHLVFDNADCGLSGPPGVALRLRPPEGVDRSKLRLEARVRVDAGGTGGGAPSGELQAFTVQALWAGSESFQYDPPATPAPRSWGFATTGLKPPAAAEPPPNDIAIVLRAGGQYATEPCRKNAPAPVRTHVTIDSIAIKEIVARLKAP